jgi:hypothetical protein
MILHQTPQARSVKPPGRNGNGSTAGPRAAAVDPGAAARPCNGAPQAKAATSADAAGRVATRPPPAAASPPAASPPAATSAAAKVAAVLTPEARQRGLLTASELAAVDRDPFGPRGSAIQAAAPRPCNGVAASSRGAPVGVAASSRGAPVGVAAAGRVAESIQGPPPRTASGPAEEPDRGLMFRDEHAEEAEAEAGPGAPVTRAEVEAATRAGRWVGLATPAAWRAAMERDEQRHASALGLLRKQLWGLYERQRIIDRDIGQLWLAVVDLQETLRRAMRGDTTQGALFGLIVENRRPCDE